MRAAGCEDLCSLLFKSNLLENELVVVNFLQLFDFLQLIGDRLLPFFNRRRQSIYTPHSHTRLIRLSSSHSIPHADMVLLLLLVLVSE